MSQWPRLTLAAGMLAGVWLAADAAEAYCRLTTEQALTSRCPEPCRTVGTPLEWRSDAVYTFNESFIPGMAEADVRRIFADGFAQWTSTDCLEGPVDVRVTQDALTTDVSGTIKDDGLSVILYRSPEQWGSLHPGADMAFALTIVAFDINTGELVGADMELNGGIGRFTECPETGCDPGDAVDLGNVVTHEAGHFLGLAHSDVAGSTMFCDAQGWQTDKRTLEPDDIDGICEIYGSAQPTVDEGGGCSTAPEGRRATGALLPVLAVLALLVARRRRHAA